MKTAIILAAGAGTRMKSRTPKVLHKVCGLSMLEHVIEQVKEASIENICVIVGHGAEEVLSKVSFAGVSFFMQENQLGTGHAVMQAEEAIPDEGNVLILCGDTPLLTGETIKSFMKYHESTDNNISVMTAFLDQPFGYGRIIKRPDKNLEKIVEEKDATDKEREITEINAGVYCFNAQTLKQNLKLISTENSQGEYYLTDLIEISKGQGGTAGTFAVDPKEIIGVNTRVQLAEVTKEMRLRIAKQHMLSGVTIIDPENVYIETGVKIGIDTIVCPGAILSKGTIMGEACIVGHNCRIENSVIGNRTEIQSSTIVDSVVGDETHIGPYAYLRPGSKIGNNVKIGDFVEVKNSTLGDGTKASHLSYIGDADVGQNVNIGCGVVFVNYDGVNKFRTIVEDGAFIGSNSNVVAPVTVRKEGYVAAGTTITREVPEGALAVGRVKERHIEGWRKRKGK